ncbi:MAG: hypothetical protein U9O96_06675 [Candidatus Thermoplasmatota archaeon]|nr:hypothetical protein [Candidatus Thermoplasmatota archaeon]
MKKIIISLCIGVFVVLIPSISFNLTKDLTKEEDEEWNKIYGESFAEAYDIEQTSDGHFIIAGHTKNWTAWLLKIDKQGNEIWNKTYGEGIFYSIVETESGYTIGGYTESRGAGKGDFWLVKVDKQGNEIWNKTYGEGNMESVRKVISTKDRYLMVGIKRYPPREDGYSDSNIWLVKVDKQGNEIWNKTYGGNWTEDGQDIIEIEDGYLVSGRTYSYEKYGGWDTWLIKIDKQGNEIWNKTYGWWDFETEAYIIEIEDGYMITGSTLSTYVGFCVGYLIKVNKAGEEIWSKKYGYKAEKFRDI